jgi:hypothetical protein
VSSTHPNWAWVSGRWGHHTAPRPPV